MFEKKDSRQARESFLYRHIFLARADSEKRILGQINVGADTVLFLLVHGSRARGSLPRCRQFEVNAVSWRRKLMDFAKSLPIRQGLCF